MDVFYLYLLIINAVGFLIMTADKLFAKSGTRRVPERTLLTAAALGGSLGVLGAMYAVRHKTRHRKFTIGVPLILTAQLGLLAWLLLR